MSIAVEHAADQLSVASSVREAVDALADGALPLAGATWIMRAPLRGEAMAERYVAVGTIPELRELDVATDHVTIGAGITHAGLAAAVTGVAGLEALATAASKSANPGVRSMATVGGNICADGFHAADLVPALLALDAEVELAGANGTEQIALADFLTDRAGRAGTLLTRVRIATIPSSSAHTRLTLRDAGDYPVANVSVAVHLDGSQVTAARVAVGSVEPVARRWPELEDRLTGQALDAAAARQAAEELAGGFDARDGVEAKGWYRTSVLPALVERAVAQLGS